MPDPENTHEGIPRLRMRQNEMDELFAFYAALSNIASAEKDMRKRLDAVPNGYRDLRLVETVLTRLCKSILQTVPEEKLYSIRCMLPKMRYKVYFYGTVCEMQNNAVAIDNSDLDVLCHLVHDYYCAFCTDDCNRCKYGIGRVFDRMFKVDRKDSWANYDIDGEDTK